MGHPRVRSIDVLGRAKPSGRAVRTVALVLGLLGALAPAGAIDFTGRIDTRYQVQAGDNAYDNDLYNYHSLDLAFTRNFTFSWYGGVIASLNDRVNTRSVDGIEVSDNAQRSLQDAGNPGQYINYSIYSAFLRYDAGVFGAMLGRCTPVDYDLTQFDGLDLWAAPLPWLRVEAFGGMPWHYAYVANPAVFTQYWTAGEIVAGGGTDFRFFDEALTFSLRYLFLREVTGSSGFISTAPLTYLSQDNLTQARLNLTPWPWLSVEAAASALDLSPLGASASVSGDIEPIHLSYSADCRMQFIDVSSVSDRLTEFAAVLTAAHPYVDASAELTENLAGFFPKGSMLSDLELELSYEHRQPFFGADLGMFNPQYDQFRVATLLGGTGAWTLQLFYSFLLTSGIENTLHVVGGEIGRKDGPFDLALGSSFNASLYQTDYTQTVLEDSFYDQEYYLKVKWQISRAFDLSLKAAYENVLLSSITSSQPLNPDVDSVAMNGLDNAARNYFRFEMRAGFRY